MNKDNFQGKWNRLKGSIKETWGDVTDNALEKVNGQRDKLVGLLQENFGETEENTEKQIDDLLKKILQLNCF